MSISELSDWEQIKIHEVVSDARKLGIILDLYPNEQLTFDELKEETNLSEDLLRRQLKCLEDVHLIESRAASVMVYFLTLVGKDLVSSYSE